MDVIPGSDRGGLALEDVWINFVVLVGYGVVLLALASPALREGSSNG